MGQNLDYAPLRFFTVTKLLHFQGFIPSIRKSILCIHFKERGSSLFCNLACTSCFLRYRRQARSESAALFKSQTLTTCRVGNDMTYEAEAELYILLTHLCYKQHLIYKLLPKILIHVYVVLCNRALKRRKMQFFCRLHPLQLILNSPLYFSYVVNRLRRSKLAEH